MKKFFGVNGRLVQVATGTGLVLAASASQAAIDVSGVVTEIEATATPIGLVGVAVLVVVAIVAAFKHVRSAIR